MASKILDQYGHPVHYTPQPPRGAGRQIRARFDSQFTTDENRRHWQMADGMSIDASASWMVRRTLRMRSRYEYHNNSYFFGIADTVGNYAIGTGPRLQMQTKNKRLNEAVEKAFREWAKIVGLAQTFRSMRVARLVNGEAFTLMRTNPRLDHPVKLDLHQVEADQVSSPMFGMYPAQYPDQFFDGVVLDPYGRPLEYHVLRQHPGAFGAFVMMGYEFDKWPARFVLHDYKRVRPGQQRGIPESIPALPLFAQLRRYTLAVLAAAETAADYAVVAQSDAPADPDDDSENPESWATFDLKARMGVVLPQGWKLGQMQAEQPTTTYDTFTWNILREIARCLNVPLTIAALDSSKSNLSAAYLDHQTFAKAVQIDRAGYECLLDRVLDEFLTEAIRVEGFLPADLPPEFPHSWFWPSIGNHADPSKVASAQQVELSAGTTTLPREYAKQGLDWESEQENEAKALGVTVDEYRAMLRQKRFAVTGMLPGQAAPGAESKPAADDDAGDEPTDDNATDD